MIRRMLRAGIAVAVLAAGPAAAEWSGHPYGPGVSINVTDATNVAAGIGNTAYQDVTAIQSGSAADGLVTTNVLTATNVAAGIGNTAHQSVTGVQDSSAPYYTVEYGPGGRVTTNVHATTNVAAGLGNTAQQSVFALQGR